MRKGGHRVGIDVVIIVNTVWLIGAKKVGLIFNECAFRVVRINSDEPAQRIVCSARRHLHTQAMVTISLGGLPR